MSYLVINNLNLTNFLMMRIKHTAISAGILTIVLVFACSCFFQHGTRVATIVTISAVLVVCSLHILNLKTHKSPVTMRVVLAIHQ